MALGSNLASIAATPQFPIVKGPVKTTVEARSADYVWQGATIANPASVYSWDLSYGPTLIADRDEALLHYLDNKGTTFPWTNPEDSVTYQVRYDPDDNPDWNRADFANCRWQIRLLPAIT